jgi:two-component system, LytTR family, response regulator LytT
MKYILIEDEPLIALDLIADIQALRPQWQMTKQARSVKQLLEILQSDLDCDLIFSDIQLGDGTCFQAFAQISPPAPVIFCTAYDQYAIQAFQTNGIGYLLKPYDQKNLLSAIEKFEHLRPAAPDWQLLLHAIQPPQTAKPSRILIHHKDRIIPLPLEDVALFYLHHEQVMVLKMDGQKYPVQQGLSELEAMCGADFFRASRQHLVSRQAILEASQYFARKLLLRLAIPFEEEVTISKEKTASFLEWLA